ncbi:MAG: DUF3592 domain-containing protein, partial [Opitutaceae bacterium]|nr:DUF3592 domain-containing protein [Opitutaceae bacterium]
GVFLLVGLGIFAALVPMAARHAATYLWNEVPCTMVESRIVDTTSVEGGAAGWHVRYAYQVDGHDYAGWRLNVNSAAGDARDDLRRSQQLAPGTTTACLVNPDDPAESVLERQSAWVLLTPLFPLVFVTVGAGGIWFAWSRRGEKPERGLTVRATRRAGAQRGGLVAGMVFGGIFLVVGISLTHMLFLRPLLGVLSARSWPAVQATVVSSEVASHDSDDGTTYSVEITYRYAVGGREYLSNRYSFMRVSSSGYGPKAEIVAAHPPGARVLCYVNPADPTDAVLQRGWSGSMAFGLIPIVFALAGGGLLYAMVRQWRAPAAGPGLTGTAAPAGVRPLSRSAYPSGGGTGAAVPEPVPGHDDVPVVLAPVASRGVKVVGTLLVALFWNGIVSVFLVQLFSGGRGGFDWFLALFLTPFVAIGLFLLGMFGKQLLSLSNPVPELTLNRRLLRPGDRLEVQWQLRGRVQAMQRLRITLEGREEATYRRGTDTRTDREVFATIDLADAADPAAIASGRVARDLPARLMHSFTAKNNKVVWALRVRGEIPRWPDVDEEFVLTIAPTTNGGIRHD